MLNDLRYALRALARTPGFTLVAVLTLALGIGATTAIFSVVNGVLLRPLRYPHADRLVTVRHALPGVGLADAGQSGGTYQHYRRHNRVFDDFGMYFESFFNLVGDGEPERIRVALVTPSVLTTLGATPHLGRLLAPEDDAAGAETGVVISHSLWTRRFGGDPAVIGRPIRIVGLAGERVPAPRPVVGVMPRDFDFPHRETQVWYSINAAPSRANLRNLYLTGIARLKLGVSPSDAEADLRRLVPSLADVYADATPELLQSSGLAPMVRPLKAVVLGNVASTLWIVLAGVALVLLIACANVANLVLVRAEHREGEAALREALGAGRREMARYFLAESGLIAALGGLLGLLAAGAGVRLLIATGPGMIPRLDDVRLDGSVLAFAAGITVLCATFFSALPLLRHGQGGLTSPLGQGRTVTAGRARQRARRLLVTWQMALALVLLVGSGLMIKSLRRLQQVDLGFNPEGALTFQPAMSYARYPNYRSAAGLQTRLLERLRSLPGVVSAEAISDLPLTAGPTYADVDFVTDEPGVSGRGVGLLGRLSFATPGYFQAMGIPFLAGGTFSAGAVQAETPPAILSARFARIVFRGEDPIGRRIRLAGEPSFPAYLVVGVVEDVAGERPGIGPTSTVYFPVMDDVVRPSFLFVPRDGMNVVLRTGQSPAALMPALRRIVAEVDPELPISGVRTMEQLAAASRARHSFAMLMLSVAALTSLFLGAVGLYGAISYVMSRRAREIGVRIALGARAGQVSRMVLRQGAAVALTGLAIGIPAAAGLTRFLRTLLFEVSPTDPAIFTGSSAVLLTVALLASYVPARRAARVDPMEALRYE